jgi:cell shape-determining protein MreC
MQLRSLPEAEGTGMNEEDFERCKFAVENLPEKELRAAVIINTRSFIENAERQAAEIERLQAENAKLKKQLDDALKKYSGSKNERAKK